LLSVSNYEEGIEIDAPDGDSPIQTLFKSMEVVTAGDVEHFGFQHVDVTMTTAINIATILGLVVFDEWLFGAPLRDEQTDDLIDETLRQTVHGMAHRPPPSRPAAQPNSRATGAPHAARVTRRKSGSRSVRSGEASSGHR
jgi:hypothetical protein